MTKLLSMLQQSALLACIALLSTSAFAAPVYDLDPNVGRYLSFDDYSLTNGINPTWQHFGPMPVALAAAGLLAGTNHLHNSKWSFMHCRIGRNTNITNSVLPVQNFNVYTPGGTNFCLYLQNRLEVLIHSPVFTSGIGTLYLDAISLKTWDINMSIYIATNMVSSLGDLVPLDDTANSNRTAIVWEPLPYDTFTLVSGDTELAYKREMNIRQPICIKITRDDIFNTTARDDYYAVIDNLRVSEPPADVAVDKDVTPFNVYPSVNRNMNVQFRIDNVPGPNSTKASTRTNVLLVSRWNYLNQVTTPWVTNKMQCVNTGDNAGNGELWQPQTAMRVYPDAGDLEYVLLCYFNGTYYQSKDYTVYPVVTNLVLFPPENKSPRLYSADGITDGSGSITNNPFIFPLRLFPSEHETVSTVLYVNGSTNPVVLPMTLVGTNKWQGKYDVVNHPDTTNLLWFFEATGAFTNNFRTFPGKVYWQNTNRDRIQNGTLPYGDNCGMTDGSLTNRPEDWFGVNITPGESSYVLFTLDTAKTNYLAGRGEYQNFNAWNTGAYAQNFFSDADDKYPKVSYSQNFSLNWPQSYFTGMSNWFLTSTAYTQAQVDAIRVGPENILNEVAWSAGSFQYVVERTVGNTRPDYSGTASQRRNQAVRLFGGSQPLGLGYYQGNLNQQNGINGIGTITYKARLSRPIVSDPDYNYNVAYRFTDMVRSNYMMTATGFRASQVSPEQPSISLVAYYQNARRFYEYRLTQVTDSRDLGTGTAINTGRDKRVRHEIWKWNGSNTPIRIAYFESTTGTWPDPTAAYDAFITETFDLEFRINSGGTGTSLAVKFKNSVEIPFVNENGATLNGTVVVDGTSPIRFGSYGFHSADCTIIFPTLTLKTTGANANPGIGTPEPVIGSSSSGHANEWYWPTELYLISGLSFASAAQSTTVKVLTGTSELGPWTPFATQTVSSYAYAATPFSAATNAWNNLCAKIQANDTVGVVVDGIRVGSWRGETFTASPSDGWKITEGWLNYNPTDTWFAHLDATQADPSLIQGVRSERIVGLGSISFDYRATAVPAQIKVQYTSNAFPQDDTNFGWVDVTNINISAAAGWVSANYYLAMAPATSLYVRVINNIGTNPKATVDVRNIVIWNNPTNSPNDWAAYNMKISDTETDKWWLDKKTVSETDTDKARSGYMNNSTSANTIPTRPMTQFNPYIMAPRLTRGLGTISFLARAFTTGYAAGDTNTSITVYVTTSEWDKNRPDALWTKVHTFTGITNGFYRPLFYSHPIVPNDIKAVKLVVHGVTPSIPSPQRVCIDEIVVTEAIYPRFDITGVKLLLPGSPNPIVTQQPLEGEDIGIEAQLTNVLLEPQDIQVWITYVLGTNTWGVFNAPLNKQFTKAMSLVDPGERIYRTVGDFMNTGIPEQDKYNVVQYIVWAEYFGNGFHKIYQSTNTAGAFANPSWYFPVDLNKEGNKVTGAPKPAWTPYYITYDVPPGSVWINELNLNENSSDIGPKVFINPYIEIAQPAWMDLSGWRMEIQNLYYETRLAFRIEAATAVQPALGANGYGLFVIGPYAFEATTATPPYPPLSTTTTVHQAIQNIRGSAGASLYPGGYRLVRPMGMYEHAIAYEWDRDTVNWATGETFVNNEPAPQTPFKFVGREHYNGSLAFTGTVESVSGQYARTDTTNTWQPGLTTFNWTPGKMNIGQTFPIAPVPGGSNVLITSTLVSPDGLTHGWQNNFRQNPLQFKLKKGQGTNFVYVAEPWFRFYGVTSNNVQLLSPAQQTSITNYSLALVDVQTNINILSDLRLAPSVIGSVTTPGMIEWLQQYPDRALAPSYFGAVGTNSPLSMTEKYWLDMDPTQTNRLLFSNKAIEPDTFGLWLTLEMATINQAGQTNRLTRLLGDSMVSIWIKESFTAQPYRVFGQYWISDRSFDSNYWARTRINAYTNTSAWFKWRLDINDQRLATNELINVPAP
jgi:hypothetical protein